MRPALRLLPLVAAAVVAGCGQAPSSAGDFKGGEKDVAEVIEELQTAAQSRKPEDICSEVLSRRLADRLKTADGDCVDTMEKVTGDADDFELEVTDVAINGTTATAKVEARREGKKDAVTTFTLVQEDGDWRLSNLGEG